MLLSIDLNSDTISCRDPPPLGSVELLAFDSGGRASSSAVGCALATSSSMAGGLDICKPAQVESFAFSTALTAVSVFFFTSVCVLISRSFFAVSTLSLTTVSFISVLLGVADCTSSCSCTDVGFTVVLSGLLLWLDTTEYDLLCSEDLLCFGILNPDSDPFGNEAGSPPCPLLLPSFSVLAWCGSTTGGPADTADVFDAIPDCCFSMALRLCTKLDAAFVYLELFK